MRTNSIISKGMKRHIPEVRKRMQTETRPRFNFGDRVFHHDPEATEEDAGVNMRAAVVGSEYLSGEGWRYDIQYGPHFDGLNGSADGVPEAELDADA